jgi:hypothetical protein
MISEIFSRRMIVAYGNYSMLSGILDSFPITHALCPGGITPRLNVYQVWKQRIAFTKMRDQKKRDLE